MDLPELPEGRISAGREFDEKLRSLGLDASAVFWAYDSTMKCHVLAVVTDFFDFMGPLAVSELLFEAYNQSALPQEVDPFIVRLHSPHHAAMYPIFDAMKKFEKTLGAPGAIGTRDSSLIGVGDLLIWDGWVVSFRPHKKRSSGELLRKWKRFENVVHQLAA